VNEDRLAYGVEVGEFKEYAPPTDNPYEFPISQAANSNLLDADDINLSRLEKAGKDISVIKNIILDLNGYLNLREEELSLVKSAICTQKCYSYFCLIPFLGCIFADCINQCCVQDKVDKVIGIRSAYRQKAVFYACNNNPMFIQKYGFWLKVSHFPSYISIRTDQYTEKEQFEVNTMNQWLSNPVTAKQGINSQQIEMMHMNQKAMMNGGPNQMNIGMNQQPMMGNNNMQAQLMMNQMNPGMNQMNMGMNQMNMGMNQMNMMGNNNNMGQNPLMANPMNQGGMN
jgi:hypothetical protein